MSAISIVYLWIIYVLFLRWKERILVAAGVMWLLTIPYMLLINTTLSRMLSEPVIDVWDILSAFLLLVAAVTFFVCDYVKRKIQSTFKLYAGLLFPSGTITAKED